MLTRIILLVLTWACFATSARAADADGPLQPKGPWALTPTTADCTLSRDYDSGNGEVILGFRPASNGDLNEILLVTNSDQDRVWNKATELRLGSSAPMPIKSYSYVIGRSRTTIFYVDPAEMRDIETAQTITLRSGSSERVFAVRGGHTVFAALNRCQDTLMDQLGLFPYERRPSSLPADAPKVVMPKGTSPGEWITNNDYPEPALRLKLQGEVMIIWTIGIDGRVHDCKPLVSSGSALLDNAACTALVERGRYKPATDAAGKPIPIHAFRTVVWRLPGDPLS